MHVAVYLVLAIQALQSLLVPQSCSAADLTSPQKDIRQKILDGVCCVPNLSSGYTPYQMTNGAYKKKENDTEHRIDLHTVTFGMLDKKPVAVALLDDSGGG